MFIAFVLFMVLCLCGGAFWRVAGTVGTSRCVVVPIFPGALHPDGHALPGCGRADAAVTDVGQASLVRFAAGLSGALKIELEGAHDRSLL